MASGVHALGLNNIGSFNTTIGVGIRNTAIGYQALSSRTNGDNTATKYQALVSNTTGADNTAIGWQALGTIPSAATTSPSATRSLSNTAGNYNIALGFFEGSAVTTANHGIPIGAAAANVSDTTWIRNIYGVTTRASSTNSKSQRTG